MYRVFESLSKQKKENIINNALNEFAEKGYEKASTNSIVKKAGISKGILFHYFKTKRDLYRYVILYSMDILYNKMIKMMKLKSTDYFERMLEVSAIKMQVQYENPKIYSIVINVFKSNQEDMKKEIFDRYMPLINEYYKILNDGLDMTKFKEGIDINKLNQLTTWIGEGLLDKHISNISDKVEDMSKVRKLLEDEFMSYVEIIKCGAYK